MNRIQFISVSELANGWFEGRIVVTAENEFGHQHLISNTRLVAITLKELNCILTKYYDYDKQLENRGKNKPL